MHQLFHGEQIASQNRWLKEAATCSTQAKFSAQEELLVDKALEEMLEKEIVKETVNEEVEFVSPIFVTTKSDACVRSVLNLKRLTEFVKYGDFKMNDLRR